MHRAACLLLLLLGLSGSAVRADPLSADAALPPLGPPPAAAPAPLPDFATAWRDSAGIYGDPPLDSGSDFLTLLAPPPAEPARPERAILSGDPAPAAKPVAAAPANASPLTLHTAIGGLPSARPAAGGIVATAPVTAQGFDRSPYYIPAVNEAAIKVLGGKARTKSLIERAKAIPKPLAGGLLLLGGLAIYAAVRRR